MRAFDTQADDLARIGKAHDLTPAIRQDAIKGQGTGLDAIHVGDRIALGKEKLLALDAPELSVSEALLEAVPG